MCRFVIVHSPRVQSFFCGVPEVCASSGNFRSPREVGDLFAVSYLVTFDGEVFLRSLAKLKAGLDEDKRHTMRGRRTEDMLADFTLVLLQAI